MDTNPTTGLKAVAEYLAQIAPGEITDTTKTERLLAVAWDYLLRDDGGMRPDKLFGRMESVVWQPPLLTFLIERHGGMACGSSRAEMQSWTIDVERGTASCEKTGYRQRLPRQRPLDVKPLADEIAAAILKHSDEPRLKWVDEKTVRVNIGVIFPKGSAVKMTLAGRRKRFQETLAERLETHGWVPVGSNKYQFKSDK